MPYIECLTKNCHNTDYNNGRRNYCNYCKCLQYECTKIVGEYGYCEDHRCSEPGCCKSKSEECQHSYYQWQPKCRMCEKRRCQDTPYCNEHGCLKVAFTNGRHIYCEKRAKLGQRNCDEHLKYCQRPDCFALHVKGSFRCGYDGAPFWRLKQNACGSTECRTCPVRRNFLLTFFTVTLECDFPILEAVVEHSTK
jgi:hypothetical protein